MRRLEIVTLALLLWSPPVAESARASESPKLVDVFESRTGGAHTYRIPAIITTKEGTLLAFAEARRASRSDAGDIDLVFKRNEDDGETWPHSRLLHEKSAAYSCMTVLHDGQVGVLFERDGYGKISFAKFPIDWVTEKSSQKKN